MSTLALALGEINLGTATFLGAVLIVVMPTIIMVLGCCVRAGGDGSDAAIRCVGCAYDLRASTTGRCPECGHAVALDAPADLEDAGLGELPHAERGAEARCRGTVVSASRVPNA